MMDTDDIAPPPVAPKPPDLEAMSIEELEARIEELEAEIARMREAIAAKRATRSDADALFRLQGKAERRDPG